MQIYKYIVDINKGLNFQVLKKYAFTTYFVRQSYSPLLFSGRWGAIYCKVDVFNY